MINWLVRYSKILQTYPQLFDPQYSVLEIGSGGNGIAPYLRRKVTGLDQKFPDSINEFIHPVVGDVCNLEFEDGTFDYVVCVDVLEHLQSKMRRAAICEMLRVSKNCLLISCPISEVSNYGENTFKNMLETLRLPCPDWLHEHLIYGLPEASELISLMKDLGYALEITPNESFLQHYGAVLLDTLFPISQSLINIFTSKGTVTAPIIDNPWDLYYSYLFTLHKTQPKLREEPLTLRQKISIPLGYQPAETQPEAIVYSVYHEQFPTQHLKNVIPIFAGEYARTLNDKVLTDQTQSTAPLNNTLWNELSAIYKIWKDGPRCKIVGFCHYRRLFDFTGDKTRNKLTDFESLIDYSIPESIFADFESAIITPIPESLTTSVFNHYSFIHNTNDLCLLYTLIINKYRFLAPFICEQFSDNKLYANNMFISKWEDFEELCTIWFDILSSIEEIISGDRGNRYQNRYIAFLAERLFDIWIRYKKASGIRIVEVGTFLVRAGKHELGDWTRLKV